MENQEVNGWHLRNRENGLILDEYINARNPDKRITAMTLLGNFLALNHQQFDDTPGF